MNKLNKVKKVGKKNQIPLVKIIVFFRKTVKIFFFRYPPKKRKKCHSPPKNLVMKLSFKAVKREGVSRLNPV